MVKPMAKNNNSRADRREDSQQLKLSANKIDAYKEAFDIFDKNNDGRITKSDFGRVMTSLGLKVSQRELDHITDKANGGSDGTLTFYDFMKMVITDSDGSNEDNLFQAFKIFDMDRDGFITPAELRVAMEKLGEKMSEQEARHMVKLADINGDGKIDYGEFVVMMKDSRF